MTHLTIIDFAGHLLLVCLTCGGSRFIWSQPGYEDFRDWHRGCA
jgi:hypothetical protein